MSSCNRCNAEIKWPVPFVKGNKPLNLDDTPHTCNTASTQETTPQSILERCTLFLEAFKDLEPAKFDSLARIFISGMMNK